MKRSKGGQSESGPAVLIKQQYILLQDELKYILEKVNGLNNTVIEERDLNKIAKSLSNRINEISSLISSTVFTTKAFYELSLSNTEQFTTVAMEMERSLLQLKRDNEALSEKCLKPPVCDMSVNTDEKFLTTPAHVIALQKMEEKLATREIELNSRIQTLVSDRKQLKMRVVEQYSSIQTLKLEIQDLERKRRADKILIEELEADTSLLLPRYPYTNSTRYGESNAHRQERRIMDDDQDFDSADRDYLVSSTDVDRFLDKLSKNDKHIHNTDASHPTIQTSKSRNTSEGDGLSPSVSSGPRAAATYRYSQYEPSSDEDTSPQRLLGGRNVRLDDELRDDRSADDSLAYSEASGSFGSLRNVGSVFPDRDTELTSDYVGDDDHYDALAPPPPPPPPFYSTPADVPPVSSSGNSNVSVRSRVSRIPVPSSSSSRPPLSGRPISKEEDRRRKKSQSKEVDDEQGALTAAEVEDGTADDSDLHPVSQDLHGEIYDFAEEIPYEEEEEADSHRYDHDGEEQEDVEEEDDEEYRPHKSVYVVDREESYSEHTVDDEGEEEDDDYYYHNEGNTSSESMPNPLAVSADDSITMIHKYF